MPMQKINRVGLCKCYHCGSKNVALWADASKKFRIQCGDCGTKTRWENKDDAIIEWFNLYIRGPVHGRKIRKEIDQARAAAREDLAERKAKALAERIKQNADQQ